MSSYSRISVRGLYRSRSGIILGVCRGLADYFDFSVFWVRAIVVILFIFTGFWPVGGLYILAALLMKSEPAKYGGMKKKCGYDDRFNRVKSDTADRLRRKWRHLEKRIRRMEDKVTSREFDWNQRFRG